MEEKDPGWMARILDFRKKVKSAGRLFFHLVVSSWRRGSRNYKRLVRIEILPFEGDMQLIPHGKL
jgi:hypothetical protein